jgi:pyruvate dehydrogenase E2 component (dihydrolipoamide acetyltransferase)
LPAVPAPSPAPSILPRTGRVFASPLAKSLAKEKGVDLGLVTGTGPNGRVIAADVKEFVPPVQAQVAAPAPSVAAKAAAPKPAVTVAPPVSGVGFTDYPLSEASKAIAARLTMAKQTVPHYYLTVDLLLGKLLEARDRLNKDLDDGDKISVNDILIKAAALASKKVPEANASWYGDFVRQYHAVDVNLLVGIGDGLVAPVVKGADTKGIKAISSEVKKLVGGAAEGSLTPEAYQTGTLTVVNLGIYGIKSVAPIVSLPQACILGIGSIENRVVPKEKPKEGEDIYEIVPGVTVTLSCDHRVIDGAVGAQWLSAFKGLVEDPLTLIL